MPTSVRAVLVTGATGNTGGALLQRLKEQGVAVRALVRRSGRALAHYSRGEASRVHSTVRELTGTEPRDIAAFARDYAQAFVGRWPASGP